MRLNGACELHTFAQAVCGECLVFLDQVCGRSGARGDGHWIPCPEPVMSSLAPGLSRLFPVCDTAVEAVQAAACDDRPLPASSRYAGTLCPVAPGPEPWFGSRSRTPASNAPQRFHQRGHQQTSDDRYHATQPTKLSRELNPPFRTTPRPLERQCVQILVASCIRRKTAPGHWSPGLQFAEE